MVQVERFCWLAPVRICGGRYVVKGYRLLPVGELRRCRDKDEFYDTLELAIDGFNQLMDTEAKRIESLGQ